MAKDVAAMGKADDQGMIQRGLRELRKIIKEAANELLEAVPDRKQQLENEIWKEMDDYIFSWEPEKRIGDPDRKNLANGVEQQYEIRKSGAGLLMRLWQKSKSWVEKKRKKVRDKGGQSPLKPGITVWFGPNQVLCE